MQRLVPCIRGFVVRVFGQFFRVCVQLACAMITAGASSQTLHSFLPRWYDAEYKETKLLKQGKKHLAAPFAELARWIASTWNVTVLNVTYGRNPLNRPRLQIILEYPADIHPEMQSAVAEKFSVIMGRDAAHRFDADGLFVVFSAFAPWANEDADSQITEKEIRALKVRIGNPDLWTIARCYGNVTFLFFTDDQVKRYEAEGKKSVYASMYFALLKPHDQFGYLQEKDFRIKFDSKQNFDKNYKSSWYYYYR